ncbi:MAG: FKBP-type peptidyl-prolyl cis-trans isomerase [Saprospiraceae bacterium]
MRLILSFLLFSIPFISQAKSFSNATDTIITIEGYLNANDIKPQRSDKRVYYHIESYGDGVQPKAGDYVKVRFKGKLLNGNVFDESAEDEPFVFQLGYRQVILGWEHGIPLFQVGSKGSLFVPAELGYGNQGVGSVPANSPLHFEIEVLGILSFDEYDAYMVEMEKKQRMRFEAEKEKQFVADKKIIQDYIISKKIKKAKRDDSGLSYALTKKGKGDLPQAGDVVEVSYTGYLTDGSVFDKGKYTVPLGKGKVIKGWEEGLPYFKKGSEGWIFIPSKLAYGPRPIEEDDISIPANSVLVFKIKVKDIKRKSS